MRVALCCGAFLIRIYIPRSSSPSLSSKNNKLYDLVTKQREKHLVSLICSWLDFHNQPDSSINILDLRTRLLSYLLTFADTPAKTINGLVINNAVSLGLHCKIPSSFMYMRSMIRSYLMVINIFRQLMLVVLLRTTRTVRFRYSTPQLVCCSFLQILDIHSPKMIRLSTMLTLFPTVEKFEFSKLSLSDSACCDDE